MIPAEIRAAGDSAVILRLGGAIDPALNARALALARRVRERGPDTLLDLVVGFASVTAYFDPLRIDSSAIESLLREAAAEPVDTPAEDAAPVVIPVTYGGADGADLGEVAAFAGLSEADVIARHLGREYRVFMIGFLPGFPYMGTVDPRIAMPRRDTPRVSVPAGSVGIAGGQTGIYPVESPGGWRLIGRTTTALFDPANASRPTLLQPGDRVRFVRA